MVNAHHTVGIPGVCQAFGTTADERETGIQFEANNDCIQHIVSRIQRLLLYRNLDLHSIWFRITRLPVPRQ